MIKPKIFWNYLKRLLLRSRIASQRPETPFESDDPISNVSIELDSPYGSMKLFKTRSGLHYRVDTIRLPSGTQERFFVSEKPMNEYPGTLWLVRWKSAETQSQISADEIIEKFTIDLSHQQNQHLT